MKNIANALAAALIAASTGIPQVSAENANFCQSRQQPEFSFGFAELKSQVGAAMGDAIECEHANAQNGDTLQRTTTGLAFYRSSTNMPTFTNGSDHWGLVDGQLAYWTGTGIDPPDVAVPSTPVPPISTPAPVALSEADIAARVVPSVVQVLTVDGAGSGISLAAGVVTNEHVVHGASRVDLFTSDGQRFGATVISTDLIRDLALLVPDLKLPTVEMESAGGQRQGDQLLVLGYPRPSILGIGGQASLTRGLLSAIRQDNGVTYIQTDATINPGNSGGPVLNMRGNVVGVVDFTLKDSVGLNFAIATESIQAFLAAPLAIAAPRSTPASGVTPAPDQPPAQIVAAIFRGDPRSVATTSADIASDAWIQTYEGSRDPGKFQRVLSYRGREASGISGRTITQIIVSVLVASSVESAASEWEQDQSHLTAGWQLVTPPSIADAQFTERKTGQLSVRARANNVILVLNMESEDPSYSPYDMVVSLVRQMASRVREASH